ncbi:cobyric acid synthase [Brevibacillus fluminis]|uniref:Cobyric acid synthase n=1 Tax=Brevibacillus fluminis TaxID=511487 RepID=A0A3M8DNH4_9BACL|nr:cobyric acid synthase [Brevibacillus fluminis]RNB89633.1 cobyric acid synthase [Brevibacillus fluminis]
MKARAIMVQGTSSDAGKSMLATALCRIFANQGFKVAPFKSQNMALNSYVTKSGGEIGRAQGVQAEAARIEPTTDMNPILLKPKQDMVAEMIVHGKRFADLDASDYRASYVRQAMPFVSESYDRLAAEYDVLVIEGAGSPAEINLRDRDIANMRIAELADAAVILVADIERGGVFASIIGTLALLTESERKRIKGFVINKFRGRRELLDDGVEWLERETGIPVLAVLPYFDVGIDAEDSLALASLRFKRPRSDEFSIDIAILRLPRISNFTDFDPLFDEPEAGVRYVRHVGELGTPDLLIIPGTKNTLDDLNWLRGAGFEQPIRSLRAKGTQIIGICGGYQMLGERLFDPDGVENGQSEAAGLGFLPIDTVFQAEKKTVQMTGRLIAAWEDALELEGYEIHLGISTMTGSAQPFLQLADGRLDGAVSVDGQVFGTYLHGLFHNRSFTRELCNRLRVKKGLDPLDRNVLTEADRREEAYEGLARHVVEHMDMEKVYQLLNVKENGGVRV